MTEEEEKKSIQNTVIILFYLLCQPCLPAGSLLFAGEIVSCYPGRYQTQRHAWASHLLFVCPQGEVLYRVRWKNYCSDDDTWEPEAHLEDCREVLLAFKKSMAEIKAKKEAEAKKTVVSLSDSRVYRIGTVLYSVHNNALVAG